jgi:hypothetical protein
MSGSSLAISESSWARGQILKICTYRVPYGNWIAESLGNCAPPASSAGHGSATVAMFVLTENTIFALDAFAPQWIAFLQTRSEGTMFDPDEQHYSVQELASRWRVSADSVRRKFRKEEGVLHLGTAKRNRRTYDPIRIPRSVAERVYRRLTGGQP